MSRDAVSVIIGQSPIITERHFTAQYALMYYVYLLQSIKTKQFYVGFTKNPQERLRKHNKGDVPSTKNKRPWKIIYVEGYLDKRDALGREKFLKSGGGKKYLRKQLHNYRGKIAS